MKAYRLLFTFISGALVGAVSGLLLAPRSGSKSRKKLKRNYETLQKSVETEATKRLDEAKSILNEEVNKRAGTAKKAIDNVAEFVATK